MSDCVLVTGGAGFIGSHTVVELCLASYAVIIVDNFSNSSVEVIRRLETITQRKILYYDVDMCDLAALEKIFEKHPISVVIHFAGLKAVGESVEIPLAYYHNNLFSGINLLKAMSKSNVKKLIYSSSCTVYGEPNSLPISEVHPTGRCSNPYANTKLFFEQILDDLHISDSLWNIVKLRYFNPVGAHSSGTIGEAPIGKPNNLMPFITQVAIGKRDCLFIFGNDYPTVDGTGVRDYIHVVDLAKGHVAAVSKVKSKCGIKAYNLGSGIGYSVLQLVSAMEKASGKKIPHKFVNRRAGDLAEIYADAKLAFEELGWRATLDLDHMCADSWCWQQQNPNGYEAL